MAPSPQPSPTPPNPSQSHSPPTTNSNLSNQLADLRNSYDHSGSTPPIQNIPPRPSGFINSPNLPSGSPSTTPSQYASYLQNARRFSSSVQAHDRPFSALDSTNSPNLGPHSFSSRSGLPQPSSLKSPSTTPVLGSQGQHDSSVEDLTDRQKAQIVRRHLMTREEQDAARRQMHQDSSSVAHLDLGDDEPGPSEDRRPADSEQYPAPFHLQGGDVHHAVYKWANKQPGAFNPAQASTSLALNRTRSVSMSGTSIRGSEGGGIMAAFDEPDESPGLMYKDILEPGGFRRAFLHQKRAAIGKPYDQPDGKRFTKSFIDFLSLYGHFGGEDLEEIDEGEEAAFRALQAAESMEDGRSEHNSDDDDLLASSEQTPLVGRQARPPNRLRQPSKGRSRTSSGARRYPGFRDGSNGDATVMQAVLMLLKSLVGTGVLFLAKAFSNGGMLFSVLMIVCISLISLFSFVLLVETRLEIPGGFGEIGGILYGPWCRRAILFSLVVSQLGFVAAYTIFIAQNLQAFVLAVSDCKMLVPIYVLIFGQLLAYLPLAMIRNIQKLSGTALIADVFILIGLLYVFGYELDSIAKIGVAPIVMFNPESFPLLIGTAVFAFEGIGLVIPITESMKEPQKFPAVLSGVMVGLTILFAGAGACGYAAFGSNVQTVVLVNLPQDDKSVNAVQFLYSMAIMLSTPLQLFPAVRIMENGLFSSSGKYSNQVKWKKNMFRTATVTFCAFIAWAGASDLDKFVSLIGSVACVPLCFCYPAMLHYRAIAKTKVQKLADIALFVFGVSAAIYTTLQTINLISSSGDHESGNPKLGKCTVP